MQFPQLPLEEIGLDGVLKQPNNYISSLQSNFRSDEVYQGRDADAPMKRIWKCILPNTFKTLDSSSTVLKLVLSYEFSNTKMHCKTKNQTKSKKLWNFEQCLPDSNGHLKVKRNTQAARRTGNFCHRPLYSIWLISILTELFIIPTLTGNL